jgi:hypothetical protein
MGKSRGTPRPLGNPPFPTTTSGHRRGTTRPMILVLLLRGAMIRLPDHLATSGGRPRHARIAD